MYGMTSHHMISHRIAGIQLVRQIVLGEGEKVTGVAWLENKIYTASTKSSIVRTFQDHIPFNEETPIEVKDMKIPCIMACSKVNRAIFVGDWERNYDAAEKREVEKEEQQEEVEKEGNEGACI